MNTFRVAFTLDELWLMHAVIRHESDQDKTWSFPPTGLDLNRRLAAEILHVEEMAGVEGELELSKGDLLVIDCNINAGMKDQFGKPIGKEILLKAFASWRDLDLGFPHSEVEERDYEVPTAIELIRDHGLIRRDSDAPGNPDPD